MGNSKNLKVIVDVRNLDCIKNTVKVINNSIYENKGIVSEYNKNLLGALLGSDWNEKYVLGKIYLS